MLCFSSKLPRFIRRTARKRKKAALFSICVFYSYAAALLDKLEKVHEEHFFGEESTIEKPLSAQTSQTMNFSLCVRTMSLTTMTLFSNDVSDRRKTFVARAKGAPSVLLAWFHHTSCPSGKRRYYKRGRSSPPMSPASSRRLKRPVSTRFCAPLVMPAAWDTFAQAGSRKRP